LGAFGPPFWELPDPLDHQKRGFQDLLDPSDHQKRGSNGHLDVLLLNNILIAEAVKKSVFCSPIGGVSKSKRGPYPAGLELAPGNSNPFLKKPPLEKNLDVFFDQKSEKTGSLKTGVLTPFF